MELLQIVLSVVFFLLTSTVVFYHLNTKANEKELVKLRRQRNIMLDIINDHRMRYPLNGVTYVDMERIIEASAEVTVAVRDIVLRPILPPEIEKKKN